ncbi:hypothetical protein FACS189445_5960 [Spirochaetia bacterium]|nr:hypothetical protein FACS189445_5960 [Spirochaetia bacterium]
MKIVRKTGTIGVPGTLRVPIIALICAVMVVLAGCDPLNQEGSTEKAGLGQTDGSQAGVGGSEQTGTDTEDGVKDYGEETPVTPDTGETLAQTLLKIKASIEGPAASVRAVYKSNYVIDLKDYTETRITPKEGELIYVGDTAATVTLINTGSEKVISHREAVAGVEDPDIVTRNSLFRVGKNITLVIDGNITLNGLSEAEDGPGLAATGSLIHVMPNGALELKGNTKITGNIILSPIGQQAMKGNGEYPFVWPNGRGAFGGGVFIDDGAQFTMGGSAKITGNGIIGTDRGGSLQGGGVFISSKGNTRFVMEGDAEISNNSLIYQPGPNDISVSTDGGGVAIGTGETESGTKIVILKDNAKITGNKIDNKTARSLILSGGGINFGSVGKFTITDNAEVSNNSIEHTTTGNVFVSGGGINIPGISGYFPNGSTNGDFITISGNAKVSGNTITAVTTSANGAGNVGHVDGAGIFAGQNTAVTISGNAQITDNTGIQRAKAPGAGSNNGVDGFSLGARGGGILAMGKFTMTGGTISGNKVETDNDGGSAGNAFGGAIYFGNLRNVRTISGGVFSGNQAVSTRNNGTVVEGIFVDEANEVKLSGNVVIDEIALFSQYVSAIMTGSLPTTNTDPTKKTYTDNGDGTYTIDHRAFGAIVFDELFTGSINKLDLIYPWDYEGKGAFWATKKGQVEPVILKWDPEYISHLSAFPANITLGEFKREGKNPVTGQAESNSITAADYGIDPASGKLKGNS